DPSAPPCGWPRLSTADTSIYFPHFAGTVAATMNDTTSTAAADTSAGTSTFANVDRLHVPIVTIAPPRPMDHVFADGLTLPSRVLFSAIVAPLVSKAARYVIDAPL